MPAAVQCLDFRPPTPKPLAGGGVARPLNLEKRLDLNHGRRTARRGPAWKPASSRSGIASDSPDRLAVEALDREPLQPAAADVRDERLERRAEPALLGIAQRDERAAAALDEEDGLSPEQDDVRARDPGGARAGPAGPGQRGAVRLRRIGGREDERLRSSSSPAAQLAQPLDGAPERELRAAEALDEVAASAEAERLERAQLPVDRAVAARDSLGADAVARDDSLPLEQQLGERAAVRRRRGTGDR